ncbi:NAD-glutamate dehydrogenase [soil metagenome]
MATADRDDAGALEAVLAALDEQLPDREADLARALGRAVYRRVPAERVRVLEPEQAAARLAAMYRFLRDREPGSVALAVHNPTAEADGWAADGTVAQVNVEDGPFLLSTVGEEVKRQDLSVHEALHPVVGVERDDRGRVAGLGPARHSRRRESLLHLELDQRLDEDRLGRLREGLSRVLDDALAAMSDFAPMRDRMREVAAAVESAAGARYERDEIDEALALVEWLLDDHFILLGARDYEIVEGGDGPALRVRPGSGLGILRDESTSSYAQPVALSSLDEGLRERLRAGDLLLVSRTNTLSTVHERTRMVYVGIKAVDDDGEVRGEHRFIGLFAHKAVASPATTIPVLRRKLTRIMEREDIVEHSYDERTLRGIFESFPKTELFQADDEDLGETLLQLLDMQRRGQVRLLCRVYNDRRSVSALVALPQDRFTAGVRHRVQDLLREHFQPVGVDYYLSMGRYDQALLHFVLHFDREQDPDVPVDQLEREVVALTRTWADELTDRLVAAHGPRRGRELAGRWVERFPVGYRDVVGVELALRDVDELEALVDGDVEARVALQADPAGTRGLTRFKLYRAGPDVELSTFVPIIESFGLVVVEEEGPHRLQLDDGDEGARVIHLHDFGVTDVWHEGLDVDTDGPRLADAAIAIWRGRAEADSLNRLIPHAGLSWDEVKVLRAYRRYRRQIGTSFTESYIDDALVRYTDVARALAGLFAAKFDPKRDGPGAWADDQDGSDEQVAEARQTVVDALEEVERLDQDRILRAFLGMIDATVRTNHYAEGGRWRLALKFDSARVPDMPRPRPFAEVFVYTPEMEGVHLRSGPVARGGIRHSDRQEDFRAEVLGLMKAQVVKNGVIVPTGSKGGYVLKRPPADPGERREEGRRRYETYIRGLLDVTDNIVDGRVKAPQGVRPRDGDDPYLVVAPDKGTATFSDLANAVSEDYGFWLGDAFASGGSRGFDHKAMGITARGAWVAVQRHFRELDVDVQHDPVTVVGIGDMSGDVFGNALLRSRSVKLLAAFDHRHLFIDPDPDPEASYEERARLFEQESSSWDDYDRERISEGGGVWARSQKLVRLSAEARRALHIDEESLSPPELIHRILRAPVDLLFAGGVGTFVKSSEETNVDVADRANDAVRVDADQVGARVVGEGGNLAVTQRGRIQFARRGGRINMDAVDNAAGVDTSDHEVNLKILLRTAVDRGDLGDDERDDLLADAADEVAERVLRNVYLQTWALSQEVRGSRRLSAYERLMTELVRTGRFERDVEGLPSPEEMRRRHQAEAGLARPELAVLLAHAKIDLAARVTDSGLPDRPALRCTLEGYFPESVRRRFDPLLDEHRLRRELIATVVANDLVDRMGTTYAHRTAAELGVDAVDVVAGYWSARTVTDADGHWQALEALDGVVEPTVQMDLKEEVDRLVDAVTRAYLRHGADTDVDATVERDRPVFERIRREIGELAPADLQRAHDRRAGRYSSDGVDDVLAERIVDLTYLASVPDIAAVARDHDRDPAGVAQVFFSLADTLPFERLLDHLTRVEPRDRWQRMEHQGLFDDVHDLQRVAAARVVESTDELDAKAVDAFLEQRPRARDWAIGLVDSLDDEDPRLDAVAVGVRALRHLLEV